MNCPSCGRLLTQMQAGDITVDVCDGGCGGIWFDAFELQKVDEARESAGESILAVKRDPDVFVDHDKRCMCPKCDDTIMMRHFFSVKRKVEVDECPACGGFWLDAGELSAIRAQFASSEERDKATDAYFGDLFGEDLERMRAESQENAQKAGTIARMFRFICPTYYVPGKQDWGAF